MDFELICHISFCLIFLLSILFETTESAATDPCPNSALPQGSSFWTNTQSEQVTVTWQLPACVNSTDCLGLQTPFNFPSMFQQKPLHIQDEVTLLFQCAVKSTIYYRVPSPDEFINCNFTNALTINGSVISLENRYLASGNNYFLAKGDEFFDMCTFGYKLNVTVQDFDCSDKNNVCNGKGRCVALPWDSNFECNCCAGERGEYCGEVDGCYDVICKNNGVCVDLPDKKLTSTIFKCNCTFGFTGEYCENQTLDYCSVNQCMNGGTCFNAATNLSTYTCACTNRYTGKVCEDFIDFCKSNPCLNGGMCQSTAIQPYYQCNCIQGFQGSNCEMDQGLCIGFCKNGGTCTVHNNSPACNCVLGYKGNDCSKIDSGCDSNPCSIHSSECIMNISGYFCTCKPGYTGKNCEVNIDECASNPCPPGEQCMDGVTQYSCGQLLSSSHQVASTHYTTIVNEPVKVVTADTSGSLKTDTTGDQSGLSPVAIAFIVIGVLLLVALIIFLLWYCVYKQKYKTFGRGKRAEYERQTDTFINPNMIPTVYTGVYPNLFNDADYPKVSTEDNDNPLVRKRNYNKF